MQDKPYEQLLHDHIDALKKDHAAFALWGQLLQWARFKPQLKPDALLGVPLGTGQLATTERVLMRNLGIKSTGIVRRILAKLTKLGLISVSASEAGSLITVKHLAESKHLSKHQESAEDVAAQGVQDEPISDRSTSRTMNKTELEKTVINPNQTRVRVDPDPAPPTGGVKEQDSVSEPEAEMLAYAQQRLGRVFGKTETMGFVDTWRGHPWIAADELRRSIDFIASHPRARKETRSIKRAFFGKQLRASYGEWNEAFARLVAEELRRGRAAEEIVARALDALPSCEREIVGDWTLREIERQTA